MQPNHSARRQQAQRIRTRAAQSDSYTFFNLLTGAEFLDQVEALLPAHRERLSPPTEVLSMFLAQALSADRSCQQAVNDSAIKRLKGGLAVCSTGTGALLPSTPAVTAIDGFGPGPARGPIDGRSRAVSLALAESAGTFG
jgi:hypothetical protein